MDIAGIDIAHAVGAGDITGALTGAIDELIEPKSSRGEGEDQEDGGSRR